MNTQLLAERIVKRLRAASGRIGSADDAARDAVVIIRAELDRAVKEHEARIPILYAKGADE